MLACAGGHLECVKLLLNANCNTSLCNDTGRTGRELAEELHRDEILSYLQGWGGIADAKGMGAAAAAAATGGGAAPAAAERPRGSSRGEKSEKRGRRKSEGKVSKEKKKSSKDKPPKSAKTRVRSNTAGGAGTESMAL